MLVLLRARATVRNLAGGLGEAETFHGGHDWLAEHGVEVVVLDDRECVDLMRGFVEIHPALWNEDIGHE